MGIIQMADFLRPSVPHGAGGFAFVWLNFKGKNRAHYFSKIFSSPIELSVFWRDALLSLHQPAWGQAK